MDMISIYHDGYGEQYFDKVNSRHSELNKDIFEECQDSRRNMCSLIRHCNQVIRLKLYYTCLT